MAENTPRYPLVGQTVNYFATQATNPMPATLAEDLGAGRYNLRVVSPDGTAAAQANVLFITVGDTIPASGEYCMSPGAGL